MLGLRKEEAGNGAAHQRLSVWCDGCQADVDVMEWWADGELGKAVCPWCSEHFYARTDVAFDPANLLGLRAHPR